MRSFDYLAASGELFGGAGQSEAIEARKRDIIERFLQVCERSFINAYTQASSAIPHQWSGPQSWRTLLDLFLLEKAAYEISYEAANRPNWLPVPLRGLGGLAARLLPDWPSAAHAAGEGAPPPKEPTKNGLGEGKLT